ncbi:PCYCGC motif-containing (lipo)protein (plasmid) [Metabacillus halosaccharovorans]
MKVRKMVQLLGDDHGTRCGVCLEFAAQSVLDYQGGKR